MRQSKQEKMYGLVKKWQGSGQSKVQFSKVHGLRTQIFYYWVNKYEKAQDLSSITEQSVTSKEESFIPLSISGFAPSQLELYYPNGVRLQISGQVPSDYIGALVKLGSHV